VSIKLFKKQLQPR